MIHDMEVDLTKFTERVRPHFYHAELLLIGMRHGNRETFACVRTILNDAVCNAPPDIVYELYSALVGYTRSKKFGEPDEPN